jgi:hypothetical protein
LQDFKTSMYLGRYKTTKMQRAALNEQNRECLQF